MAAVSLRSMHDGCECERLRSCVYGCSMCARALAHRPLRTKIPTAAQRALRMSECLMHVYALRCHNRISYGRYYYCADNYKHTRIEEYCEYEDGERKYNS